LHKPLQLRHRDVDETRRRWDTAPAFVLGTVWGRGADATCKVRSAPCLSSTKTTA
jgi:hypothetical protein